jgi:hypothetical protein
VRETIFLPQVEKEGSYLGGCTVLERVKANDKVLWKVLHQANGGVGSAGRRSVGFFLLFLWKANWHMNLHEPSGASQEHNSIPSL